MRIGGINIPDQKHLVFALTAIYGIGRSRAAAILLQANIDPMKRGREMTLEEENVVRKIIEGFKVEGDLRREVAGNIKRLKDIKSYRGSRHTRRLPLRGQRTKTNSRTVRGNVRKTMTSGRRKVEKT
ncbi:30S ribosomal protein S13 [Candidatus Kaiserbacteria bacterium RIFCSPHIGHO2_02_FULL_50_9]|uniref:Small ribosomal subunit protein uS13 n=1 Tax=Candidatus Kaiserbacteria bacterium RIFCSPLOWO2_01_FULL_51_21 TaxID=1798508 RepID=A0A1F6EEX5_9BACT|nr:MAG: 30S ribosomal protein S13 [Candidatus Kaiserbacteria bacterium RIFCSPHIGHO2_02_FULL_50_9]OGG71772.1 MAG: 30S ribosomal protein S13 [Candidatus Kaiserbacteria bacterium RIFCSPLOWO2_01_FULL_51_21]